MSDQNAVESIKDLLNERARSPLWSTFALTWGAWNFKFFMVLFSSIPVWEKIYAIENKIFRFRYFGFDNSESILGGQLINNSINAFLIPFTVTILIILISPYPSRWVYKWSHRHATELKNDKKDIDKLKTFDKKERDELFDEISKLREKHKAENAGRIKEMIDMEEKHADESKKLNEFVENLKAELILAQENLEKNRVDENTLLILKQEFRYTILGKIADRLYHNVKEAPKNPVPDFANPPPDPDPIVCHIEAGEVWYIKREKNGDLQSWSDPLIAGHGLSKYNTVNEFIIRFDDNTKSELLEIAAN